MEAELIKGYEQKKKKEKKNIMNFSADSLVFDWPACGPDHREVSSQISELSITVRY